MQTHNSLVSFKGMYNCGVYERIILASADIYYKIIPASNGQVNGKYIAMLGGRHENKSIILSILKPKQVIKNRSTSVVQAGLK